jgi:hypothetical protein
VLPAVPWPGGARCQAQRPESPGVWHRLLLCADCAAEAARIGFVVLAVVNDQHEPDCDEIAAVLREQRNARRARMQMA